MYIYFGKNVILKRQEAFKYIFDAHRHYHVAMVHMYILLTYIFKCMLQIVKDSFAPRTLQWSYWRYHYVLVSSVNN